MTVECQRCGGHFETPRALLGTEITCPHCKTLVLFTLNVKSAEADTPTPLHFASTSRLRLQPLQSTRPLGHPPSPPPPPPPPVLAPVATVPPVVQKPEPSEENPPPSPKTGGALLWQKTSVRVVCLIGILLLAVVVLAVQNFKNVVSLMGKTEGNTTNLMSREGGRPALASMVNDLVVLNFDLERQTPPPPTIKKGKKKKKPLPASNLAASPLVFVSGVATNSSTNVYLSVKVSFELLDAAGKVVETNYDQTLRFEGQTAWNFKAMVANKDAAKPRLIGIHGDK